MRATHVHNLRHEFAGLLGGAVDDCAGAELRNRLVEAGGLGKLGGAHEQHRRGVGVLQVGDDGLGHGLGGLVHVVQHHKAHLRGEGQHVK